jgi:hypothetical protein
MHKPLEKQLAGLERLLQELMQAHTRLLELLGEKRVAMREAKHDVMAKICQMENEQIKLISELEKQRLQMVADVTLLIEPSASAPLKLLELADRLPEPWRGRILVFRHQLQQKMQATQKEAQVTQQATVQLMKHMTGLMQKVTAACTGASVYSAKGAPSNRTRISTFSMTA